MKVFFNSGSVVLRLQRVYESRGGFVKTRITDYPSKASDSVGVRWDPRMRISNTPSGDAHAAGPEAMR